MDVSLVAVEVRLGRRVFSHSSDGRYGVMGDNRENGQDRWSRLRVAGSETTNDVAYLPRLWLGQTSKIPTTMASSGEQATSQTNYNITSGQAFGTLEAFLLHYNTPSQQNTHVLA